MQIDCLMQKQQVLKIVNYKNTKAEKQFALFKVYYLQRKVLGKAETKADNHKRKLSKGNSNKW